MERLAASVALRIASGTSRALPWPKPTRPRWSPTTTRAAKPKRRPPLTTFATRLMWTSLSTNSLSRFSSRCSRCPDRSLCAMPVPPVDREIKITPASVRALEAQPALARGVGQRLDAAMIEIGAAVEDDLADAGRPGALGHEAPDLGRRRHVGARLQPLAQILVEARGGRQSVAVRVVDHLRVDVLGGAEHGQPQPAVRDRKSAV